MSHLTCVSWSWYLFFSCRAFVWLVEPHFWTWTFLPFGYSLWLIRATCPCYYGFFHKLYANLPDHRAMSIECNATSGFRFWIWTAMRPNLSMSFQRDSSSALRRLARAISVIQCDQLVTYYKLKRSTRVLNLSMDLGGSPPYQVMPPLWGTLGRHDTGLHCHYCIDSPRWGKRPDAHLDQWFHHTALGWVVSILGVC